MRKTQRKSSRRRRAGVSLFPATGVTRKTKLRRGRARQCTGNDNKIAEYIAAVGLFFFAVGRVTPPPAPLRPRARDVFRFVFLSRTKSPVRATDWASGRGDRRPKSISETTRAP
ncbi:hypothetical protein EVAR_52635_1 [Eumeta japonica]|uniref:Uncharacterized protein n=1 Tax=Eumeta variegata TaxID=151549 RepID=A0A4C1Y0H5_EUMVA|nr:hypothetical protein EVAR_52635_1 [Eumeta japonica]